MRERYLEDFKKSETEKAFLDIQKEGIEVDWPAIEDKVAAELEAERARSGAKPYTAASG